VSGGLTVSTWGQRLGLPAMTGARGLVAAVAIDSLGTGLFVPFALLYFLHTTPLSLTAIGGALTLAGLIALPVPFATAPLIDRCRPKVMIAGANLLSGAAFTAYLFVGNRPELVAAALAVNVGQRTFWTGTRALIARIAGPAGRPAWFALQAMTSNAGYGLGGLLGGIAVGVGGQDTLRVLAALNALSFFAAAALYLRWRPPAQATATTTSDAADHLARSRPSAPSYRAVLADRRLWRITGVNLIFVLCASALPVLLAVYLVDTLHQPAWLAGVIFAVNTFLLVAAQTTVTARTRARSAQRILQLAGAAYASSFVILWALSAAPGPVILPLLLVAVLLFALAEMLNGPMINALAVGIAPATAPGRYLAVFQLSWSLGSALAPAMLTWLLSRGPSWPWIVLIALCALTTAVLAPTPENLQPLSAVALADTPVPATPRASRQPPPQIGQGQTSQRSQHQTLLCLARAHGRIQRPGEVPVAGFPRSADTPAWRPAFRTSPRRARADCRVGIHRSNNP
jgi:MFS family permease